MSRFGAYIDGYRGFERDARVFLIASLLASAAISLYWINFNLYLAALGQSTATIGLIATVSALVSAVVAFPMSALSDRIGRKRVILIGASIAVVALIGLLSTTSLPLLWVFGAAFAAGQQTIGVVSVPYMAEHSSPNQRSELFSLQYASTQLTSIVAGLIGGAVATAAAGSASQSGVAASASGTDVYRVIFVLQLAFMLGAAAVTSFLAADRPAATSGIVAAARSSGRLRFPMPGSWLGARVRDRKTFVRLLIPGFLISLGAGQIIPFLNLFVAGKFDVDLAAINWIYALTSLGTMVAILLQPALAKRYGKVASVVIVQGASIPFLAVLGFSPVLWSVIVAMAVRNSLMNAGNPIQNAYAMERVRPSERALMAASTSALWSLGWVLAGPYYSFMQANLGFTAGYAVSFLTIIAFYSLATALYWIWFHGTETGHGALAAAASRP